MLAAVARPQQKRSTLGGVHPEAGMNDTMFFARLVALFAFGFVTLYLVHRQIRTAGLASLAVTMALMLYEQYQATPRLGLLVAAAVNLVVGAGIAWLHLRDRARSRRPTP